MRRPCTAARWSVVSTTLKGFPLAATMRWANPPTIFNRSASMSINHSSVRGKLLIRSRNPFTSSGV